ncbi:MAG: hypothetical protein KGL39_29340 [Patescibacteria group bacterium]|nr:hypothetical protein [Patescibacteria group bacterium]
MTPNKALREERERATHMLREMLHPGQTIYTILRYVSRSGMMRHVSVVVIQDGRPRQIDGLVATATGLKLTEGRDKEGIRVGGCGVDAGFEVVYSLARVLYPEGFGCVGDKCSSNDHSNGDYDRTPHTPESPHWHEAGGYAFRREWL